MVISNLNLHWVNDLPQTISKIRTVLKDDGVFLATMFGENTLDQLRSSFMIAEQEREGGISNHVSPFIGFTDAGNIITQAQLTLPTIDSEVINIRYKNAFVLMHELKAMAENNALLNRRPTVARSTLLATAAIYQTLFEDDEGAVPASFHIVYMIGWTPDPSQPKPKPRGSAEKSLKDIGTGFAL
eukprot:TRINITY_DN1962_c0_g1_i2.p1 TRINITY_DN1962_c0_g1~~TRINITY_DN1962_c0_g1_i2.p1  ORF type:complete len:185 (+),score=43.56 TRINITY_DN1962_c0_g1_i2:565-1119(+)